MHLLNEITSRQAGEAEGRIWWGNGLADGLLEELHRSCRAELSRAIATASSLMYEQRCIRADTNMQPHLRNAVAHDLS